jgi:hypothetical protein
MGNVAFEFQGKLAGYELMDRLYVCKSLDSSYFGIGENGVNG